MKVWQDKDVLYVDLHGLNVSQARQRLQALLEHAPPQTARVVVIHGYNRGQSLQEMVRNFTHPRIKRTSPAYHAGQTVLELR